MISVIYYLPCFCDEAKRVAFICIFFSLIAYPKNPHPDQKKNQKKNRPSDGTDTVRRQVKKKHKKSHNVAEV
jgi:hypothetical protein